MPQTQVIPHRRGSVRQAGAIIKNPEVAAFVRASGAGDCAAALDEFVTGLKNDGLWQEIDFIAPLCGPTLSSALCCLKHPAGPGYKMTPVAMVESDYVARGWGSGLTGNGSTKYLRTGFIAKLHTTTPNGIHCAVFTSRMPAAVSNGYSFGAQYTTPAYNLGDNRISDSVNSNFGATMAGPWNGPGTNQIKPPYVGLLIGSGYGRFSGYGSTTLYRNAVSIASGTNASGGAQLVGGEAFILASNFNGSATSYNTSTLGYVSAGGFMTAAQVANYNRRVNDLMASMGRFAQTRLDPITHTNFVLIGQSLACGQTATPIASARTQYKQHKCLENGPYAFTSTGTAVAATGRLVPLAEGTNNSGTFGETVCSAFVNALTANGWQNAGIPAGAPISGSPYSSMASGTVNYRNGITLAAACRSAALSAGASSFTSGAVLCVHGEADATNSSYDSNLATWQSDHETDLKAVSGQAGTIPLITSQCQSYCSTSQGSNTITQPSDLKQLAAYLANPTKILLACPKYMMTHNASDGVHLGAAGSAWVGEYYAKAYWSWLTSGSWTPLYPLSVVRSGATITAVFSRGGLAFDTTIVSDQSTTLASKDFSGTVNSVVIKYGFEFVDDTPTTPSASITGTPTISTTNIANDTVTITLSGTPTGANKRLRYACTGTAGAVAGPTAGIRGNLRDSDTSFSSLFGNTLYNWCLSFDMDAS